MGAHGKMLQMPPLAMACNIRAVLDEVLNSCLEDLFALPVAQSVLKAKRQCLITVRPGF